MIKEFITDEYGSAVWDSYNVLHANAYRADFFRYLLLYKVGGWYSDVDLDPGASLASLKLPRVADFVAARVSFAHQMVDPAYMGATVGHPVLHLAIASILGDILWRKQPDADVWFGMTGPHRLGRAVNTWHGRPMDYPQQPGLYEAVGGAGPTSLVIISNRSGWYTHDGATRVAFGQQCDKRHNNEVLYGPGTFERMATLTHPMIPSILVSTSPS